MKTTNKTTAIANGERREGPEGRGPEAVPPTPGEWRCLRAIQKLMAQQPWSPSQQEIAAEMGVALGSIPYLLTGLEKKGLVRRAKRKARTLEVCA